MRKDTAKDQSHDEAHGLPGAQRREGYGFGTTRRENSSKYAGTCWGKQSWGEAEERHENGEGEGRFGDRHRE